MTRLASGPGSADPLTAITRSDDVSSRRALLGVGLEHPLEHDRDDDQRVGARARRPPAPSPAGQSAVCRTIVEDSAVASSTWAKPHA